MYPLSAPRFEFDLQRYAGLLDVADLISHYQDPHDLFRELAPRLRNVFRFDLLNFALHDPTRNVMKMQLWADGVWPAAIGEFPVEESAAGEVWQTQQTLVIDDVQSEKRFASGIGWLRDHGARWYTVVPLTTLDQRMGALGFGLRRAEGVSAQEIEFLKRAAEIVSLGVYNAQSRESALILAMESVRTQKALQLLQEIDASLTSELSLQQHLFALSLCIQRAIPHDHAAVGICEPDGKSLRLMALDPTLKAMLKGEAEIITLQENVLTEAFMNRATAILRHTDLAALELPIADRALEIGIRSLVGAPMIAANGLIGVLCLASRTEDAFKQPDLNLLKQISSAIALWMENALTRESARKEKERLQALLEIDGALSQSGAEFRTVFPVIAKTLNKVVRHDLAMLNVMDWQSGTLRVYAWSGKIGDRVPLGDAGVLVEKSSAVELMGSREGRILGAEQLEPIATRLPALQATLKAGVKSACFVPLITSAGVIGNLVLAGRDEPGFAEDDLQFLKRLAPEMAFALENTLAHRALTEERKRLQALRELDSLLISRPEVEQLWPAVSACLGTVIPHDDLAICLYDAGASALRSFSAASAVKRTVVPPDGLIPLENTLTGEAYLARRTRVHNHSDILRSTSPLALRALEAGVRSVCFVPLCTPQGSLGVMTLTSRADQAFPREGTDILEQAGSAIALTLENALAHRALQREKDRLMVLFKTGSSVVTNFDPQRGFSRISAHVRRLKRHEFASLTLRDREKGFYEHILDFPFGKGIVVPDSNMSIEGSPMEKALQARTPIIFSRQGIAAFDCRFTAELLQEGIKSLCCVPVSSSREILGTLNLGSTRENAFRSEDFGLLQQVATQIAAALENERTRREIKHLKSRLAQEKQHLEGEIRSEQHFEEIIGDSPVLKRVLEQVTTVASSDATVLILGETGTGKELIARAIHRLSLRKHASFIKMNCAAIPTGLLESELFGHEKGAFTGAVSQKIGRLELADRGTLFLDEVGEIALDLQPKLLRVLQDQEFERLGGVKTIKVNLRLIAATNRDMTKSVSEHEFRSDLFYRLNVFPVHLPPLRERREDIPMLVRHFVHKYASRMNRKIENVSAEIMEALAGWDWPGNVRELENFMERSVILSEGPSLRVPTAELRSMGPASPTGDTLDSADREHIIRVLRESGGVLAGPDGAARKLGLKRTTLQSKMKRLGIERADYAGLERD
jgi:formate hydrogenlyase transcriptional activator